MDRVVLGTLPTLCIDIESSERVSCGSCNTSQSATLSSGTPTTLGLTTTDLLISNAESGGDDLLLSTPPLAAGLIWESGMRPLPPNE